MSAAGFEIAWTSAPGASGYIVEIEQDELGVGLKVELPASSSTFAVPDGFLQAGVEYELGIGTKTEVGNVSFVETTFSTSE